MKKWLIAILALLVIFFTWVYLFIPNFISITQNVAVNANPRGLQRNLYDDDNWKKWWPESIKMNEESGVPEFIYNDHIYTIRDKKISSLTIAIIEKDTTAITSLTFLGAKVDSTTLNWETRIPTSYNPLKRLQRYFAAKQLSRDMHSILEKMRAHFSKIENVYEYDIRKARVVDSTLVSTFAKSQGYPGNELVYGLVDSLKEYIASQSGKETGFPMLNISTPDSVNYLTRVAIPVDKKLPSSGNIVYKWMLGGGNILITEVKGGPVTINNAIKHVEEYVVDYNRVTPAIHFLSLVTDRRQEPDTTKWITRIYYPVM